MNDTNQSGQSGSRRGILTNPIGRLVDSVVPSVVDAVDVDDVVERIDVNALVERIDLDELLARIDINALLARIDVGQLVDRIDVNNLMGRVDVNALVARLEVDPLLDRIDLERLLGRIDLDALLASVDVDALIGRVDVDAVVRRVDVDSVVDRVDVDGLLGRVDVDALIDRVDIDRIVRRADLAGIVADSTRGITDTTIDLVRRQIVGLDEIITRVAARVMRRDPRDDPPGPRALQPPDGTYPSGRWGPSISGHYAGPLARLAAMSVDVFAVVFGFGAATAVLRWTLELVFGLDKSDWSLGPPWSTALLFLWAAVYFIVPLAMTGRTIGKAIVGLRVVTSEGDPLRPRQAVVRELVLPVSVSTFGLGLIGGVIGRRRRTLHDVAARSAEVIDWGDRPAELPSPLSQWLARHNESQIGLPGSAVT